MGVAAAAAAAAATHRKRRNGALTVTEKEALYKGSTSLKQRQELHEHVIDEADDTHTVTICTPNVFA